MVELAKDQAIHFRDGTLIDINCNILPTLAILTQTDCIRAFNQQSVCYAHELLQKVVTGRETVSQAAWKLKVIQKALQDSYSDCLSRAR